MYVLDIELIPISDSRLRYKLTTYNYTNSRILTKRGGILYRFYLIAEPFSCIFFSCGPVVQVSRDRSRSGPGVVAYGE